MATINIQRLSEYNNRMRDYKIFVDGQQIGKIANGETVAFATTAGKHIVTAKIDWCSSPDFSIDTGDNETTYLKVGGFKYGNWLMRISGGIIALHFILKMTSDIEWTIFLVIPSFLLLLYYITFGRKKYLTLIETNFSSL
jgi:hypothetical protein